MENHIIKTSLSEELCDFDNLLSENLNLHVFEIDCSKMEKYGDFSTRRRSDSYLKNIFKSLDQISTSSIYWFECLNIADADKSKEEILKLKTTKGLGGYRATPKFNKNKDTTCLYLGVRKGGKRKRDGLTHISGRISNHLGYYRFDNYSCLQLVHWSNRKIKLSVLELPKGASKYLYILEKFYAIKLRPLLGTH